MATEMKIDNGKSALPDFDKTYRLETESDKQWDLRKKFLEKYWNQYDEDRLLCLAR